MEAAAKLAVAQLSKFASNLPDLIVHKQVLSPQDFASQLHLAEGHLYGGEMTLTQAFNLRPIPGFANQTPIENLHLCGAATHPGAGLSGLSGRNAALHLGVKLAKSNKESALAMR